MIKVTDTFFGTQVEADGTHENILSNFSDIVRALKQNNYSLDEILKAVEEGFKENRKIKAVDGKKVSDDDIEKVAGEIIDSTLEAFDKAMAKLKKKEEED